MSQCYSQHQHRRYFMLAAGLAALIAGESLLLVSIPIIGGSEFLRLLFNSEYAAHFELFSLFSFVAVAQCVSAELLFLLRTMRMFRATAIFSTINMAVLLIACTLLVPRFGTEGAAWSMLVGFCFSSLMTVAVLAVVWRGWLKEPAAAV